MTTFTTTSYGALGLTLALASSALFATAAPAQELGDVLGGFGEATAAEEAASDGGEVFGQVFDATSGAPIEGVTVILQWPTPAAGGSPKQAVAVTDSNGAFRFSDIPPGSYGVSYVKSGYRVSTMKNFEVAAGQLSRADFPMPPIAAAASADVLDLDAFVVEASTIDEMMGNLELRMDSDALLNTMSAEEFAKYAASDVADALKRVAGINVVEGEFAVIRGLEDRYSSTLYNGAPVPSPDPNRQSPQLDLFPSEVVANLIVAKTFEADMPSNSSAGSIDIITNEFPDDWEIKLKASMSFDENALESFVPYEPGSPIGVEDDSQNVLGSEYGVMVAGSEQWAERQFRFKGLFNWETDYETVFGTIEKREPRRGDTRQGRSADLALGELGLSGGAFDTTTSADERQITGYGGFGFDLDEAGDHRIDTSVFYTTKRQEIAESRSDGYLPNFDYSGFVNAENSGQAIRRGDFNDFATAGAWIAQTVREAAEVQPDRGPYWFNAFFEGKSFHRDRDLLISQANGAHHFSSVEGLSANWAANYAQTAQQDESYATKYFYEACGFNTAVPCPAGVGAPPTPTRFPVTVDALGPGGKYATAFGNIYSVNDIRERQGFGRLDLDYERTIADWLDVEVSTGGWYEHARRGVDSSFLEGNFVGGASQFALLSDTPRDLGKLIFGAGGLDRNVATGELESLRNSSNDSLREVGAWSLSAKGTFWEDFDAFAGVRVEKLFIESRNDPYTGELAFDGSPGIYPSKYLFLDRLDNPTRAEVSRPPAAGTVFNDQILGIDVPVDTTTTDCNPQRSTERRGCVDLVTRSDIDALVNGEIDELLVLPNVGLTYRALDGLVLRSAYSQTVARPSFRELGFYVSVEPGSDDLVVGNPQLGTSDVRSVDGRVEYNWGDLGDLFAVSGFYKTIQDPIEAFIIRDPANRDDTSGAIFRTFFNNPNQATLWGFEVEARKNLGFLGHEFFEYFSIGANATYIDARVDRTPIELQRASEFFIAAPGDDVAYSGLSSSRRLFGQPEWLANADLSFDQPDWGTRFTLAYFGISDVLIGAGTALPGPDGRARGFVLDRYADSFHQLDLIFSQRLWRGVSFKFRIKNLTDSTRRTIYDSDQTSSEIAEREFKVGRDYKFSVSVDF